MSIIDKVKQNLNNFNGEELVFSMIFIITLFFIFQKAKTHKINNSTEHLLNIVLYTSFVSICFFISWLLLENVFKIENIPPVSVLFLLLFLVIFYHVSFILIKKSFLKNLKISKNKKPSIYPFLVIPFINLLITCLYILNQSSTWLTDMDIFGNIFQLIKIDNSNPIADYIVYYLIGETIVILLNIVYINNGFEKKSSLDVFCDNFSTDKIDNLYYPTYNCINSIEIDVSLFSMFIKTFAMIIYTIFLYKSNRTTSLN